ncbi:hypothetical protein [Thiorhodococcus fuscus]|uniref:DUF2946 domain-containing protein n=1 Tax=Thiorhodococcus fuscus TaxID=527200 RepID=A0ABW4YDM8_9GAMM
MRIPRRSATLILMLTLLVLQAQVWAAAMLGCRHEGQMTAQTMTLCQHHLPNSMPSEPAHSSLFDCQKCALHSLVTVAVPVAFALAIPDRFDPPTPVVGAERHFYRFIPRPPERPPRA